jgi:hypothetical protein
MSQISCEELINMFEKSGGKIVCEHDTRTCTLFPQNITAKITNNNKVNIGSLLSSFAYSGDFNKYVKWLPESEKSKKNMFVEDRLYDYQEKNTGGFFIEFTKDKDGFIVSK